MLIYVENWGPEWAPKIDKIVLKIKTLFGYRFMLIFVKNGPPKWQLFQHKIKKNLVFKGVRNRSRICSDLGTIFQEIPSPWNHENIEKTLCFPIFFENWPSYYRPHFGLILGIPNPPILEAKIHQKPPQEPFQRVPKNGSIFHHFLCWFMLNSGLQNDLQNQHKNA